MLFPACVISGLTTNLAVLSRDSEPARLLPLPKGPGQSNVRRSVSAMNMGQTASILTPGYILSLAAALQRSKHGAAQQNKGRQPSDLARPSAQLEVLTSDCISAACGQLSVPVALLVFNDQAPNSPYTSGLAAQKSVECALSSSRSAKSSFDLVVDLHQEYLLTDSSDLAAKSHIPKVCKLGQNL